MTRAEDLDPISQKLAKLIAEPCEVQGPAGPTTLQMRASIGFALYPRDGTTAEALIAHADAAMYVAKRTAQDA